MTGILHQMIPIVIAAVCMAAVGLLTVFFAQKSQKLNEEHGYDPAWDKSDLACAGCKFFSICGGQAALKPKDEVEFTSLKEREQMEGRKISLADQMHASTAAGAEAANARLRELKK